MWNLYPTQRIATAAILAASILTAWISMLVASPAAMAEPAWFWLSLDDTAATGPETVAATGVLAAPRRVHIWAQPRTSGAGAHHPIINPYLSLANVSLNLVSPQSTFSIDPSDIEVYNPIYSTLNPRFEELHDSSTGLTGTTNLGALPVGMAAGVIGMQGFTFDPSAADGFGDTCDAKDPGCAPTGSNGDAWLFGSFTITPTANTGTIELYLQVGLNGMSHVGEDSTSMEVQFGVDTIGVAPAAYDPSTDKQVTLPGDDADAVFSLVRPGDYDGDGEVNADDYAVWQLDFGTSLTAADGNSDGIVDAADYAIWRDNLDMAGAASLELLNRTTTVVPEPSALWLMGAFSASLGWYLKNPALWIGRTR